MEIEKFRQVIKQQREEIFGRIIDVIDGFYGEINKFTTVIKQNKDKIEDIRRKTVVNFIDTIMEAYYTNEIDSTRGKLGRKAIDTIFEISKIITERMKKS